MRLLFLQKYWYAYGIPRNLLCIYSSQKKYVYLVGLSLALIAYSISLFISCVNLLIGFD